MKTMFLMLREATGFGAFLVLLATWSAPALGQPAQPSIASVSVQSTNVVVTVHVPAGIRRVTLECRERLGAGGWEPRALARLDGTGGTTSFSLPRSRQLEVMRVRADTAELLPPSFYSGTNVFSGEPASSSNPTDPTRFDANVPTATPPGEVSGREVVESDIWRIRGDTLYFFNQLRGLQVIDLKNPDAPTVTGTLEMPAAGEDLYLLGDRHVVLLARNGCNYTESQIVVAMDTAGTPAVVARLPVSGYIQESRLVGSALYVASQTYRPVANTTNAAWEWGTLVSAFDLANPEAPVARNTIWHSGYGHVVTATDRLFFIVTQDLTNWWRSVVHSIDITSADGTMRAYESIPTAGRIGDKFKLNWDGSVLTTISQDWSQNMGVRLVTVLETFRLPDPLSAGPVGVIKLGNLELGRGESLRATRFDGSLAYIVTFFQIDPLWVVDLSNPSAPRIAGSVDVPGWSTFIQPLGNRLVTVGFETNRVAVSLFDVGNPAAPSLLSRVLLGETYSWSEANWDEKAFKVLPDAGLILVPYSGYTTNGYTSRMQLIDLDENTLVARGTLDHQFEPRRATIHGDRILSLSATELLSVDAADRDHPVVRASLSLAWTVDRVFLHGDYLVEISGGSSGWWWGWMASQRAPQLQVARADAPNDLLTELALTNLSVLGASVRDGRLYLLQGPQNGYYPWIPPNAAGASGGSNAPASKLLLTIVGLDNLPTLQIVGQTEAAVGELGWSGEFDATWPRPNVLVWAGSGFNWWWRWDIGIGLGGLAPWPLFWGSSGGRLLAFDVSQPTTPQFASDVSLGTNGSWWTFSEPFTAQGRVYLSHWSSEFIPGTTSSNNVPYDPTIPADGSGDPAQTNIVVTGTWVTRSFLDVVDYADAHQPLVRRPVNIPGTLVGLSHDGEVLYTTRIERTTNAVWGWNELLDASAYDGVGAHLIDSLILPEAYPHPLLVVGTNIFLARPYYTNGPYGYPVVVGQLDTQGGGDAKSHRLETWHLSNEGKFQSSGQVPLDRPASVLASFGGLLAAQATDGSVLLFDASNAAALRNVGHSQPESCLWFDLSRADGALGRGLWIPLGAYGVSKVPALP